MACKYCSFSINSLPHVFISSTCVGSMDDLVYVLDVGLKLCAVGCDALVDASPAFDVSALLNNSR